MDVADAEEADALLVSARWVPLAVEVASSRCEWYSLVDDGFDDEEASAVADLHGQTPQILPVEEIVAVPQVPLPQIQTVEKVVGAPVQLPPVSRPRAQARSRKARKRIAENKFKQAKLLEAQLQEIDVQVPEVQLQLAAGAAPQDKTFEKIAQTPPDRMNFLEVPQVIVPVPELQLQEIIKRVPEVQVQISQVQTLEKTVPMPPVWMKIGEVPQVQTDTFEKIVPVPQVPQTCEKIVPMPPDRMRFFEVPQVQPDVIVPVPEQQLQEIVKRVPEVQGQTSQVQTLEKTVPVPPVWISFGEVPQVQADAFVPVPKQLQEIVRRVPDVQFQTSQVQTFEKIVPYPPEWMKIVEVPQVQTDAIVPAPELQLQEIVQHDSSSAIDIELQKTLKQIQDRTNEQLRKSRIQGARTNELLMSCSVLLSQC